MSKAKSTCSYSSVQYMLLCGKCDLFWDHGEGLTRWYLKVQGGHQRKVCMSWSPQWEGEKSWSIEAKREENRRKSLCESLEAGHIWRNGEMGTYLNTDLGLMRVGDDRRQGRSARARTLGGPVCHIERLSSRSIRGPVDCVMWGWTWLCWCFRKFTHFSGNRVENWLLETLWN